MKNADKYKMAMTFLKGLDYLPEDFFDDHSTLGVTCDATVAEASEATGIAPRVIQLWAKYGKISSTHDKIYAKKLLVSIAQLKQFRRLGNKPRKKYKQRKQKGDAYVVKTSEI